ncbi:unnamed protein product [Closterium sp. NIES-54]
MPPDPGIEAVALGAGESALPGIAPAEALHTFTLDSGASNCFFCNSTTLTPLPAPVQVTLADPSGGPVLARSSTVLLCLAATFIRRPGSNLYTLNTEPAQVAASAQVSVSGPIVAPCSCRLLSHQTLLWHHCFGHPSLSRLRGMHSHLLGSGLHRSLPPLPPLPTPPCLPCIEEWQRATPHSSSFPQTLHMDVWGPASVSGQGRERYILLVVDDYTCYTTVFPLRSKGELPDVFIPWIRAVRLQLPERFCEDLPVLRLHSDRGGEFSSDLLQKFYKLSSRAIPCVFLDFPPDAPSWQFYHPTSRRVLSSQDVTFHESFPFYRLFPYRTAPLPPSPLFLAPGPPPVDPFPPQGPAPSGVSQVDPLPGTVPVEVAVDSDAARGAASKGAEPASAEPGVAEPEGAESGGAKPGGAEPAGTEPKGAEPGGAESEGAESGGAEPRGTACAGGLVGASPRLSPRWEPLSLQQLCEWFAQRTRLRSGAAGAGGSPTGGTGAAGASGVGGAGAGGTNAGGAGAGDSGAGDTGAGGARAGDTRAGGAGAGGAGAGGTGLDELELVTLEALALEALALEALELEIQEREVLALGVLDVAVLVLEALSSGDRFSFLNPPPHQSQPQLQPDSPLPAPSPYTEQTDSLNRHPALPVCAVRTSCRVPRSRPPPVRGSHIMSLRPSSVQLQVLLPPPPASSLPAVLDPESDLACAASPTVPRLQATVDTDPSFESTAASALVAKHVDFAATCRLDYATSLVAESESNCPLSVWGECALGTDVLENMHEDFECPASAVPHLMAMLLAPRGDPDAPDIPTPSSYLEAITGPYSSQWQTAMDAEMASRKSTGTYIDAFPPSGANIVESMWIFRVKRPPGSPPAFKASYVAQRFSQPQGVDFFHTFSPTPKMTTLRVLLHVADQLD